MHQIDDAVVRGGKVVLSHLPFADGQRVRVTVAPADEVAPARRPSIEEVRRELRGAVERFDDPFSPMIPHGDWEMSK